MAPFDAPRVLLVAPLGCDGSTWALRAAGYGVTRAFSPAEGTALLSREAFAMALCDVSFVDAEVSLFFDAARRHSVRAVAVSPGSAEEDADLAARVKADTVLRVPLRRDTVRRLVPA